MGHVARQNGCLDLLRNLELFLDRKKTFLSGENPVGDEIAEGKNKKKKPNGLEIAPLNHGEANEVGMNYKESENHEAHGDDAKFTRKPSCGPEEKQEDGQKNPEGQE